MMTSTEGRLRAWWPVVEAVLACVAIACLSGPTDAAQRDADQLQRARTKLDRMLQELVDREHDEVVRVIVRAAKGELADLKTLIDDRGHEVVHEFASIEALTVTMAVSDLLELASDPVVASISSDGRLGPDPVQRRPRPARPSASPAVRAVLIQTAPGHVPQVLADLAMHRDQVTTSDPKAHVIAANVHAGDVDVLARNPSVVSIVFAAGHPSNR